MEHAMTFDANKDGMLSQAELKKMAAAVIEEMSRRGGPGGHGGPGQAGPGQGGPGRGQQRGGNTGNRQRPDFDQ